ncbi:MAG: Hsp20/alpha crystallin family protein [Thermoplasmata archaeon]
MFRKEKKKEQIVPVSRTDISSRDLFSLWSDMDQLFNSFRSSIDSLFWPSEALRRPELAGLRQPLMDIEDTGKEFRVTIEVPGFKKEDVKVEVSGSTVEVSAERKQETEERRRDYLRRERSSSSLYRCFELPAEILPDKAEARMEDGVLELVLPKKEPTETGRRVIAVK